MAVRCSVCYLGFGALRILCYKCCCGCKEKDKALPKLDVLCLGFSGSGKSTLLSAAAGEESTNVEPTSGFSIKAIMTPSAILNVKEIGGSDRLCKYWNKYYDNQQGVIVVLDASPGQEVDVNCRALLEYLDDNRLKGLPHLALLNTKGCTVDNTQVLLENVEKLLSSSGKSVLVKVCSMDTTSELNDILLIFVNRILTNHNL